MKPTTPITNPHFRYVDSANTDIRKRFAAERKRLKLAEPKASNVVPLKQVK